MRIPVDLPARAPKRFSSSGSSFRLGSWAKASSPSRHLGPGRKQAKRSLRVAPGTAATAALVLPCHLFALERRGDSVTCSALWHRRAGVLRHGGGQVCTPLPIQRPLRRRCRACAVMRQGGGRSLQTTRRAMPVPGAFPVHAPGPRHAELLRPPKHMLTNSTCGCSRGARRLSHRRHHRWAQRNQR